MRVRATLIVALLALLARPDARAVGLEDDGPRVELLVLGPGDPIFTRYGHVALRVTLADGRDLAYNFGLTNFKRPNYIIDFLSGRVKFWGRPLPYEKTVARARQVDRTLTRLPLHLDATQKARLLARLEHLTHPKFRHYVYDTFRDNCATRIRDVLDEVCDGALRRASADGPSDLCYHDDVRRGFANIFGLLLAFEIVPGVEMERTRSGWEMLFHPLRLGEAVARAQIGDGDQARPLAGPALVVYTRRGPDPLAGWPDAARALILGLAAAWLLAALLARRLGRRTRGILFGLWNLKAGLLGLLLVSLHFWTDWPDMRFNWLMAGLVPLDLWLLVPTWSLLRGHRPGVRSMRLARGYIWMRIGLLLPVLLATGLVGLSPANPAPQILALAGLAFCLSVVRAEAG